jgi:putative MATE family efflux protein
VNAPQLVRDKRPVFTHGSLMRHVAVMTATGAIGLMAVFVVDLLSLFWVSRLGDQAFKAAVGYVGLTTFFAMSANIGLTIAASATVSRALGAGDRARARRLAASALTITAVFSAAMATAMFVFRDWGLATLLHARGEPAEVASHFIAISIPANVPLALGMAMSGVLRAVGDARRAMYVTLSAGIATAFLDPLLIFGFGLGVYGAAWATVVSRLILLAVGWHGAVRVHDLVAWPKLSAARGDFGPIMTIGFPAIMANMATPVGSAYTLRVFSDLGESAIAAAAIIDRVTPVAFGVIFALTGSIGPIIGQNYGARLMGRVSRALTDSFILSIGYVLVAWAALALAAPALVSAFEAKGDSAEYVRFYCQYGVSAWLFLACLFVANTAFNNLGFPMLSMAFNWGRATLGTIPFVTFGAHYGGVKGGLVGFALGCAVFGIIAVGVAYAATIRLAKGMERGDCLGSRPVGAIDRREAKTPQRGCPSLHCRGATTI